MMGITKHLSKARYDGLVNTKPRTLLIEKYEMPESENMRCMSENEL